MTKYDDLKIGDELIVRINDKEEKVRISNIIIEAYLSDYKVVVKYVDALDIEYTDFISSFIEKIVFDKEFDRAG